MNIRDVKRPIIKLALQYCVATFGTSFYHASLPKIVLSNKLDPRDKGNFGMYYYKTNTIVIYKKQHKSFVEVMDTIVHEYQHYLQDMRQYGQLEKSYVYDDHPFELEAEAIAKQHKWLAKRYVVNQLKTKT